MNTVGTVRVETATRGEAIRRGGRFSLYRLGGDGGGPAAACEAGEQA